MDKVRNKKIMSQSYIVIRALQSLKYIYVTHVTKHTNMLKKNSTVVGHCSGNMNHTMTSGGEQYFKRI